MMLKKHAQLQQMFIYIMAIIVIGFLVLFGYKSIYNILDRKCDVELQQTIISVDRYIDQSTRFGTVKKASINAPCSYQRLCFVDAGFVERGDSLSPLNAQKYPIINVNTYDGVPFNIYLLELTGDSHITFPIAFDDRIAIDDPTVINDELLCIDKLGGKFTFWLEGKGKDGIYLYQQET